MTQPRKALVCPEDTPYYHISSRCVRRAFLCGTDAYSGRCYEHRRQWVEERIQLLSSIFAIDIAAYAVMSNHYHLVIKLCPSQVDHWSVDEVLQRWTLLFKGPLLVQRYLSGETLSPAELSAVSDYTDAYRKRLADLSWFMKCLNEPIAREANKEDKCSGHFFEGCFHSQALLSEQALLSCMAYVDLNPVRAGMADRPEHSNHTSIKERISPSTTVLEAVQKQLKSDETPPSLPIKPLLPFDGPTTEHKQDGIPFAESDYLELVDMTGRINRDDKRGAIETTLPPILSRLGLDRAQWLENATSFERLYQTRFAKRRRRAA